MRLQFLPLARAMFITALCLMSVAACTPNANTNTNNTPIIVPTIANNDTNPTGAAATIVPATTAPIINEPSPAAPTAISSEPPLTAATAIPSVIPTVIPTDKPTLAPTLDPAITPTVPQNCTTGTDDRFTTISEVTYQDVYVCNGEAVTRGQNVTIHYMVFLIAEPTKAVYSTYKTKPVTFQIGGREQILGLEEGVVGMKVGSKRRLTIIPGLGYGGKGNLAQGIPSSATVIFEVELLSLNN